MHDNWGMKSNGRIDPKHSEASRSKHGGREQVNIRGLTPIAR